MRHASCVSENLNHNLRLPRHEADCSVLSVLIHSIPFSHDPWWICVVSCGILGRRHTLPDFIKQLYFVVVTGQTCVGSMNNIINSERSSFTFRVSNFEVLQTKKYTVFVYGHTTVKIRHPVRSAKSSTVGLGQYLERRRPGNTQCRRLFTSVLVQDKYFSYSLPLYLSFSKI